jgi:hypothetical protein
MSENNHETQPEPPFKNLGRALYVAIVIATTMVALSEDGYAGKLLVGAEGAGAGMYVAWKRKKKTLH